MKANANAAPVPEVSNDTLVEECIALALAVPSKGDPSKDMAKVTWGLPLMLWGPPGIGKTSRVEQASAVLGLEYGYVLPSTKQPEDFGGVPMPDGKGGLQLAVTLEAARSLAGKRGLLFVDEGTTSGRAVMHALLGVTLERLVGDLRLGGACRVIMAGNSAVDAGGIELTAPLANRLCHVDVPTPTGEGWGNWLLQGSADVGLDLTGAEASIESGWADAWAKTRALFAAFARKRSDLLHKVPAEGDPARGRAWPSPRSMEQAARVYATAMVLGTRDEVRDTLIAGCVGNGAAGELLAYITDVDLPEPRDVIAGTVEGVFPKRVDRTQALVEAVASVVAAAKKPANLDLAKGAWTYFGKVIDAGMSDVIPPAAALLSKLGLAFPKGVDTVSVPVLQKLHRSGVQQ